MGAIIGQHQGGEAGDCVKVLREKVLIGKKLDLVAVNQAALEKGMEPGRVS